MHGAMLSKQNSGASFTWSAEPTPVLDAATGLQLEYDTKVTGEVFTVSYGHKRRRRRALLQGLKGNCGERL